MSKTMSENREMKSQEQENRGLRSAGDRSRGEQRGEQIFLRPPVDIYENSAGITLKVDLPGVTRDRLDIQVDKATLTIEGEASLDMPEGMEPMYADVRSTRYRRAFTLSNELETDKVNARMKDGVLTLHVPKLAEHQPRRIEVNTG